MPLLRRLLRLDENDHDELAARVSALEADNAITHAMLEIAWALVPAWIREPIPYAFQDGWTVTTTVKAIVFEHAERQDEYRVPLPLPVDPAEHLPLQRELYMRLDYKGPTGLERFKERSKHRPRIMDMPDLSDYGESGNTVVAGDGHANNGRR
jgi:hypothetical protein